MILLPLFSLVVPSLISTSILNRNFKYNESHSKKHLNDETQKQEEYEDSKKAETVKDSLLKRLRTIGQGLVLNAHEKTTLQES